MRSLNSNHSAQKYLKGDQDQQIESDYHNLHNNTQTAEYFILHGYFGPVIMALWLNGATGRGTGQRGGLEVLLKHNNLNTNNLNTEYKR
jgi:hypothetical protein